LPRLRGSVPHHNVQKKRGAEQRTERIDRIVSFFRRGHVVPNMSKHDIELCQPVEKRVHVGMESERQS
jgi:hypothetical protein